MADSTTNLPTLAANQSAKEVVQNALNDAFSPASYWGRNAQTSGGLVWGYFGGVILSEGSPSGYIRRPNGTLTLVANTTNYIELANDGSVSSTIAGFTGGRTPLYRVIAGPLTVTSYEDLRIGGAGGGASTSGGSPLLLQATWVVGSGALEVPVNDVHVRCPVSAEIQAVSIGTIGASASCVVDIWKDTHANYPPTVADTICAAAKPTISGGIKYLDATLTGWTKVVNAGDWLVFHLESVSSFQAIFVQLHLET